MEKNLNTHFLKKIDFQSAICAWVFCALSLQPAHGKELARSPWQQYSDAGEQALKDGKIKDAQLNWQKALKEVDRCNLSDAKRALALNRLASCYESLRDYRNENAVLIGYQKIFEDQYGASDQKTLSVMKKRLFLLKELKQTKEADELLRKISEASKDTSNQNIDLGPYMADLQRRIKAVWFPPKGHEYDKVSVVFDLSRSGQMSNLHLAKTSGVQMADHAAIKAVENAAPFRKLPDGASDSIKVQFTFDYNVLTGSGGGGAFRRF